MTTPTTLPTGSVVARYDELLATLTWWRTADRHRRLDDAVAEATRLLVGEARLLDDQRFDEWLEDWSADGLLWVPIDPANHPAADQAYFLDDVRRLRERVQWRRQANAWSQLPTPRTVRVVTNVESALAADGSLLVRSSIVLHEHRAGAGHVWAGHQYHVLTPADAGGRRFRRVKIISLPELAGAVPHPGVVL